MAGRTARSRRNAGILQGAASPDEGEPDREPPARVAVVDPHPLAREKVAEIVEARGGEAIWTAGAVQDALDRASKSPPDCVIFEFGLPDGSGAELLGALRSARPLVRGVALSGYDQHAYRALTYAAGGLGYLTKAVGADSFAAALREVWAGRVLWTFQEIAMARAWWRRCAEPWRRLSARQRAVALGVGAHLTNKEIAARLGLCESTVKGYLVEILAKIGVSTRDELVAWMKAGDLTDPLVRPSLDQRDGTDVSGDPRA